MMRHSPECGLSGGLVNWIASKRYKDPALRTIPSFGRMSQRDMNPFRTITINRELEKDIFCETQGEWS
jgi:hypothetical protein